MSAFLIVLIVLSGLSVLAVLALGIVSMVRGGEFNRKHGNRLMQARVALQGVAVALLAIAYFVYHK
jgi:hypothetical protein